MTGAAEWGTPVRRARKRGQARGTSSTFQEVAVKAVVCKGPFKVAVEDVPDARVDGSTTVLLHPANA